MSADAPTKMPRRFSNWRTRQFMTSPEKTDSAATALNGSRALCEAISGPSVFRRLLNSIDHQKFHRSFLRLQPQPQLFLQRGKHAGALRVSRGNCALFRIHPQLEIGE